MSTQIVESAEFLLGKQLSEPAHFNPQSSSFWVVATHVKQLDLLFVQTGVRGLPSAHEIILMET